jgi:ubiquinone/menaquinone biosynthesis C-methylase UbiE
MAERVCPWWMGFILINPLRRLYQNPERILAPYIKRGMTILEIGPGMGYFTLPMARMVGKDGKIICVDVQERMIKSLTRRASRAGVMDRITPIVASPDSLKVGAFNGQVDFALAFDVVHEVPDQENLFSEIYLAMKRGALLLVSEPTSHSGDENFERMLEIAAAKGFSRISNPKIRGDICVVLKK